jgi:hypothetical protein
VAIFGTYIYSWQYTDIKDDPTTSDDDEFVGEQVCYWLKGASGAHSMTVVGYNDNLWIDVNGNDIIDSGEKGAFRVANSWGKFYGDEGFYWLAYDALYSTSKVPGAPSEDRWMAMMNTKVMLLTVKDSYEPSAVAKFTLNHAKRSQMGIMLGISDVTEKTPTSFWTPGAIFFQGGEYAFDGTSTPTEGSFILDFTDLYNMSIDWKVFYLSVEDNVFGDSATVKDFRLIDYEKGGTSYISSEVPQDVDGESILFPVSELGDVPPGYWAAKHIYKIYEAGITQGCSKNPPKYCPKTDVTREQMAAFIVRADDGEPPADYCDTGSPFLDVPSSSIFCKYIKRLSELGITQGCGGGNYCPKTTVKRDQMAALLVRAVDGEPPADYCDAGSPFSDVSPSDNFCKYIKKLSELGITQGCGGGNYCPKTTVKRDQMAVFLGRAFLGMP